MVLIYDPSPTHDKYLPVLPATRSASRPTLPTQSLIRSTLVKRDLRIPMRSEEPRHMTSRTVRSSRKRTVVSEKPRDKKCKNRGFRKTSAFQNFVLFSRHECLSHFFINASYSKSSVVTIGIALDLLQIRKHQHQTQIFFPYSKSTLLVYLTSQI